MNNIIVGMGEALWDVLPEGKKIGGAPANFAYHVSQFGFDSVWSVQWAMTNWVTRSCRYSRKRN